MTDRDATNDYKQEFKTLTTELTQAVHQIQDPVAIATMLYSIAEEKKSSNLVVRNINARLDTIALKLDQLTKTLEKFNKHLENNEIKPTIDISERDSEVIDYIKQKNKISAKELQDKFKYKGRNAASARLSKLYKEGILEKTFVGREVYYTRK
jgi:predicted HTH transcriptional regulator